MTILEPYINWSHPDRKATFIAAAEFILSLEKPVLVETGCYRGEHCDGQSTIILAILARETGGHVRSFDLHNTLIAQTRLQELELDCYVVFYPGDSAYKLRFLTSQIDFAYLDSYDWNDGNPILPQAHQLVEVGLLLPKMKEHSAFLLDDCDLPKGGKAGLSAGAILSAGYTETMTAYQRLFIR